MDKIKVMIVDDEPIIRKALKYEINEAHPTVECQLSDDGEVVSKEVVVLDTFASGPQLFAHLNDPQNERPDYLLCDMEFQGEPTGGITIAERISTKYKDAFGRSIRIIILSGRFDNPIESQDPVDRKNRINEIGRVVFESLRHGANAFVSKNALGGFSVENILRAISCLERGEKYYFNYPVMLTLKEAAERYFGDTEVSSLADEIDDEDKAVLLLEAAGCTAIEISQRLAPQWAESDKSVQDIQKEISRKLNIVNKSGSRIAKAIRLGIIDPRDVQFLKR